MRVRIRGFSYGHLEAAVHDAESDASEGRSEYDSKGGNDFDAAVFAAAAGGGGVSTAMEEIVDHNTQSSGDEAVENHDVLESAVRRLPAVGWV